MADERGFWGVEIGQAGLKALRLEQVEGVSKAVATAFDYVPHAKILSQPDADPEALITAALDTFLSRNAVSGDLIGLAVPGQNALTRFIQLPPVEQGKVHQIVMYEARQQIPFPLEEVIWDYQTLGGEGGEEGGYLLDAEVGLFAMKRELVLNQLKPMTDRKVEIELIQAAPLSLYNFLCYDRLKYRAGEPFEPGDDYYVVCEMGADATTLVVTNGVKIWIRNVPIGGNHFTRALVKDMKLTFAKAEHLKCNATKSPDPKAVFQSMRPVFNDYVTEIQRSIGFFSSVNKSSKISKVLGVGNGFRLAGLQKFLQQNLQYPVERVERFESLAGEKVVSDPLFQENILGFVVPYGLAIQAMGEGKIKTTLLPPEIATARKIRRKKPWAVLAASTLLASLAVSAFGYGTVMRSVSTDRWKEGEDAAKDVVDTKTAEESKYGEATGKIETTKAAADKLVGNLGTREYWLEVYRAIDECLPRDTGDALDQTDLTKKNRIKLTSITAQRVGDTATWFAALPPQSKSYLPKAEADTPPAGPGYVFTLVGQHFHSGEDKGKYEENTIGYVVHTLLKNLREWTLQQPGSPAPVPVDQIGISHATIIQNRTVKVPDPRNFTEREKTETPFINRAPGGGMAGGSRMGGEGGEMAMGRPGTPGGGMSTLPPGLNLGGPGGSQPGTVGGMAGEGGSGSPTDPTQLKYPDIDMTTFTIQFVWNPIEHSVRTETRVDPNAAAAEGAPAEGAPVEGAPVDPAAAPAIPPAG